METHNSTIDEIRRITPILTYVDEILKEVNRRVNPDKKCFSPSLNNVLAVAEKLILQYPGIDWKNFEAFKVNAGK